MKCIIIEDEIHAVQHLKLLLAKINPSIEIVASIDTVDDAVAWLSENTCDVIFLDVHLGDDLSFSIFKQVTVDAFIIFTTAYDEYAIDAFKLNSIDYLLKPVLEDPLKEAIQKYEYYNHKAKPAYNNLASLSNAYQKRFLVQFGEDIKSIFAEEVAYFYVQKRYLFITTKDGAQYLFDSNMDALEHRLDPEQFFRINRQFIVNINAITKMQNYSRGRVKVNTEPLSKEDMIVSIDRANEFKEWLNR